MQKSRTTKESIPKSLKAGNFRTRHPTSHSTMNNTSPGSRAHRLLRLGFFAALCFFAMPAAQARTITLSLEFSRQQFSTINPYYFGNTYYTVGVLVSSDIPPVTYDEVASPTPAYSGTESGYSETYFGDIGSALNAATNGVWTLTVNKGDVSQKQYTFTVLASGIGTNSFPTIQVTTPADGSPAVSTNSSFSWSGPANWSELGLADHNLDYSFYASDSPSPSTTNWTTSHPPCRWARTNSRSPIRRMALLGSRSRRRWTISPIRSPTGWAGQSWLTSSSRDS